MDMHGKDAWRRVRQARTPDRLRARPLQGSPLVDPESALGRALVRAVMIAHDRAELQRLGPVLCEGFLQGDLRKRLLQHDEWSSGVAERRLAAARRRNVTEEDT